MFFEELVEPHGVDLLVADGFGLAAGIASYQIGRRFSYFFSDQAESKCLGRIIFLVKREANRIKRVEYFAGFRNRFDVMFIRGDDTLPRPSLPVRVIVTESGSIPTIGCTLE